MQETQIIEAQLRAHYVTIGDSFRRGTKERMRTFTQASELDFVHGVL